MVSPASDYQYLVFHPGNNSPHYGFLPTYAVTAFYHGKVDTNKSLDEFKKKCLIEGLDDIALSLEKISQIDNFEKNIKENSPWLLKND